MLRIIDMREATSSDRAFAVWDTITDSFLTDDYGCQCWDTVEELVVDSKQSISKERIMRIVQLAPDWAHKTDEELQADYGKEGE